MMSVLKFFIGVQVFTITLLSCSFECKASLISSLVSNFKPFTLAVVSRPEDINKGMEKIQMIYYERKSGKENISHNYTLNQAQEIMKLVDRQKPYVLYVHGFQEYPAIISIQTVVSAYLQRGTDNIIILDWSAYSFGNYISVCGQAQDIARYAGTALGYLVDAGLNTNKLHVIGHSLGSQIVGFIGRYVNFKIPRVTALDAANPLFYQFGAEHIDKNSGLQVDALHTDGDQYGVLQPTGSVDFYANGGISLQPGCEWGGVFLTPRSICSHSRSWHFYSESVINNTAFPAIKCNSYEEFLNGKCDENDIVYFGYAVPKNISGKYYFTTNSESPYSRGLAGIKNGQSD